MPDEDRQHLKIAINDEVYSFDPDVYCTFSGLASVEQWYGEDAAELGTLLTAVGQGDPEAAACVRWLIARKEHISPNVEPRQISKTNGDFLIGPSVLVPGRSEAAKAITWELKVDGEPLVLDFDRISFTQMRVVKRRFPSVGTYIGLLNGLLGGNRKAVRAAVWLASEHAIADGTMAGPNLPLSEDGDDFSVSEVANRKGNFERWAEESDEDPVPEPPNPTATTDESSLSTKTSDSSGSGRVTRKPSGPSGSD